MSRCIVFHSDKVGTGKTTVASNLAAMLAAKGYNVSLLDGNFCAPSLHFYFNKTPDKWINDLFWRGAEVKDIMVDMTDVVDELVSANPSFSNYTKKKDGGKLWVGFCNPKLEEIHSMQQLIGMNRRQDIAAQSLGKLIRMREELSRNNFNSSYIIVDNDAGVTYWSVTFIALADIIFLTLKVREVNIEKTRKLVSDIYSPSTINYGLKIYLILNRVGSHCNSIIPHSADKTDEICNVSQLEEPNTIKKLSHDLSLDVLSAIPCFQDIGLGEKEFLAALQHPSHPFAKEIELLASSEGIRIE